MPAYLRTLIALFKCLTYNQGMDVFMGIYFTKNTDLSNAFSGKASGVVAPLTYFFGAHSCF